MLREELAAWFCSETTTLRNSRAPMSEKDGICAWCDEEEDGEWPRECGRAGITVCRRGRLGAEIARVRPGGDGGETVIEVEPDEEGLSSRR